jgi:hypothetical protein
MAAPRPKNAAPPFFVGDFSMRAFLTERLFWSALAFASVASVSLHVAAEPSPTGEPPRLSPDLERIQRSLGGSVVERFSTLRAEAEKPRNAVEEKLAAAKRREAVKALRQAAVELDAAANRLEGLELYQQADSLRDQAQQLRLDARHMSGGNPREAASALRPPSAWASPQPAAPSVTPTPAPTLAPAPEPGVPIIPQNEDDPQKTPNPSLPAPQLE